MAKALAGVVRLHEELMGAPCSAPFVQPLQLEEEEVLYYRAVISAPMDLGTMHSKLHGNEYSSPKEYFEDFRLVLDNSFRFNTIKVASSD